MIKQMKKWNIFKLLRSHQDKESLSSDLKEKDKLGSYRGSNAGNVLVVDGEVTPTGQCPRLIYLRTHRGWSPETFESDLLLPHNQISSTKLMFSGGYANEDVWEKRIPGNLPSNYVLLSEEQLDLQEVTLRNGLKFSGRPDQALCRGDVPEHILEHKGVHSIWTARTVLFKKMPKFNHVMQLANYMSILKDKHQVPMTGEIIYSSYVNYVVNPMVERLLPPYGTSGSTYLTYFFYRKRATKRSPKGWTLDSITEEEFLAERSSGNVLAKPNFIKPFVASFKVRVCHDGQFEWRRHDSLEWVRMGIGRDGVEENFMLAEKMKSNLLPNIPFAVEADMSKSNTDACHYCALKHICNGKDAPRDVVQLEEKIKSEFSLDKFPHKWETE